MAKLPEGIFGPIIGKVGPIVGATWRGVPYIRSLAPKSDKPLTQAQINNNEKFKFLNKFLTTFHPFITIGLMNKAKKMTPLNAAYSLNYQHTVVGAYPDLSIDYSKFIWSEGSLPTLEGVQFHLTADKILKLVWEQDDRRTAFFNDQLLLLVYCPALKIADGFISGVNRADKQCSLELNPKFIGHNLEVYVSLASLNRKKIANSQYLGSLSML